MKGTLILTAFETGLALILYGLYPLFYLAGLGAIDYQNENLGMLTALVFPLFIPLLINFLLIKAGIKDNNEKAVLKGMLVSLLVCLFYGLFLWHDGFFAGWFS